MKKGIIIGAIGGVLLLTAVGGGFWILRSGSLKSWLGSGDDANVHEVHAVRGSSKNSTGLIRKLAGFHDRIVKGDHSAAEQQDEIIDSIAGAFEQISNSDWKDAKNFQAMMAYVLSGGKIEVVEKFLESRTATKEQIMLAKGAMSFVLRRQKTALKLIGDVDPRSLDLSLVGPVSLALASLHAAKDPQRGVLLFDEARLHAPGTAIEEAAIRREVPVLLKKGDIGRAVALTSRFVRSFGRSLFAANFYADLAAGLALVEERQSVKAVEELSAAVEREPPDAKTDLLLSVSRAAILSGKVILAKKAADIVIAMAPESSPTKSKARLFSAAASAPTDKADSAVVELGNIPADDLDSDEIAIRDAAKGLAQAVIRAGASDAMADQGRPRARGEPEKSEGRGTLPEEPPAVLRRFETALKQADALLSAETR